MLSDNLYYIKIDHLSFISFQLEKNNARIDNDGRVWFHKGKLSIECGNGPLIYGSSSGIVDEMIQCIKWVLSSTPIEPNLEKCIGECFYKNCSNIAVNNRISKYMFTSGADCIVWLYRSGQNKYCFEVTTGSLFLDPATAFQKIHDGLLDEEDLKQWLNELTSFRNLIQNCGADD